MFFQIPAIMKQSGFPSFWINTQFAWFIIGLLFMNCANVFFEVKIGRKLFATKLARFNGSITFIGSYTLMNLKLEMQFFKNINIYLWVWTNQNFFKEKEILTPSTCALNFSLEANAFPQFSQR